MKRRSILLLLALILLGGIAGAEVSSDRVMAQSGIALDWWVFASGGGPQSGGDVQLNATLGQPVIGGSGSGAISLSAGYWYPGAGPTSAEIIFFRAFWQHNHVLITWETASEIDIQGFNLYRSETPVGTWEQVNPTIILSHYLGQPMGGTYTWHDETVVRGNPYYYSLEVLDLEDTRSVYGPAAVTFPFFLPFIQNQ